MKCERVFVKVSGHGADRNCRLQHPAEQGAWIWHPNRSRDETAFLRFRLRWLTGSAIQPVIHVSGDQRFQLRCNGEEVTFGPDRCDLQHWTVQSLRLDLDPGEHELEALVWFIAEPRALGERREEAKMEAEPAPPMAQIYHAGGFLLWTEDSECGVVNTGTAPWEVEDLTDAVTLTRPKIPFYCDVGPEFAFDLDRWEVAVPASPVVVEVPLIPNYHGVRRPGRQLFPADIPEQMRENWTDGRIRVVERGFVTENFRESDLAETHSWKKLLEGSPLTIPARSELTVLWDLEEYQCGYPQIWTDGGSGSTLKMEWAESLYEESAPDQIRSGSPKGNRDLVAGKAFLGLGDAWVFGKSVIKGVPALWWRSGRYVRLHIVTGEEPFTINRLGLRLTGYPFDTVGQWRSSDFDWDKTIPMFERSLRSSAHETWTDTPYYEQMCYVGDTRMHALSNYAWFADDRISRRALELFDWSRQPSGLVAERYPSAWRQESVTYSMIWPCMIREYAYWRDNPDFVRTLLPGMRSMLAEIESMVSPEGLMKVAPGWPFVDWVQDWVEGCGPGVREADSSILNLHWVICLLAAAQVEEASGNSDLGSRNRRLADETMSAVMRRYWDGDRQLMLDTSRNLETSEHAQFYALLTGLLTDVQQAGCLSAIRNSGIKATASTAAAFYLLEALYQCGAEEELHRRLEFWRKLRALGFRCTPEESEPTRSDAHAWSAHPLWYSLSAIAGIRSAAPGFRTVRIAPCPGTFRHLDCVMVHPRGRIRAEMKFGTDHVSGTIVLPEGTSGEFVWKGESRPLSPGRNLLG